MIKVAAENPNAKGELRGIVIALPHTDAPGTTDDPGPINHPIDPPIDSM